MDNLELLSKLDVGTILAVAAMFWWFNTRMDKKFDKIDRRFKEIDEHISKLNNDMIEVKTVLKLRDWKTDPKTNP